MSTVILGVLVGGFAVLLGTYGWRHAPELAQRTDLRHSQQHRVNVLRRGAAACWVAGVFIAVGSIVAVAVK